MKLLIFTAAKEGKFWLISGKSLHLWNSVYSLAQKDEMMSKDRHIKRWNKTVQERGKSAIEQVLEKHERSSLSLSRCEEIRKG